MLKKIKATLVLVLPTLIIFSGIVNANANPKDCVSIFEELIKTSNFLPEVKSRKYFKIDLYDVSVTMEIGGKYEKVKVCSSVFHNICN